MKHDARKTSREGENRCLQSESLIYNIIVNSVMTVRALWSRPGVDRRSMVLESKEVYEEDLSVRLLPTHLKHRFQRRLSSYSGASEVDERLRGWAWSVRPLKPPYDISVPVSAITQGYCGNMRNVFIRHVMGVEPGTTGREYDDYVFNYLVTEAYCHAKKEIYCRGVMSGTELKSIMDSYYNSVVEALRSLGENVVDLKERLGWMRMVWGMITDQIETAVDTVLAGQPHIGTDELVNAALPIIISNRFVGERLGLANSFSSYIWMPERTVINLRMGRRLRFHRLATVASAFFAECIYEQPIDVGCILYANLGGTDGLELEYDIFSIDDSARREMIDLRDQALQIVHLRKDPGIADFCPPECPYYHVCHESTKNG